MNCAEYWESQGIDPLDAALTVGCPKAMGELPSQGTATVVMLLILIAAVVLWWFNRRAGYDDGGLFG